MYLLNQKISSRSIACYTSVFLLTLANSSFALQGASFKSDSSSTVKPMSSMPKPALKVRKRVMKAKPMVKVSSLAAGSVGSGLGNRVNGLSSAGSKATIIPVGTGRIVSFVASSTGEVYNQRKAIAYENNIDHASINIAQKDVNGTRVVAKKKRVKRSVKVAPKSVASNKMLGFKFNNYDSPAPKAKPKMMRKRVMTKKVKPVVEAPVSVMKGFKFRKF